MLGDVETRKAVTTWNLGKAVEQQQVGNAWTEGSNIVSLSLSGDLNIFDKRAGDKPSRVLYVCLPGFHGITQPHSLMDRPPREPSRPSPPRPTQAHSSQASQTAECSRSTVLTIRVLRDLAIRIS